MADPWAVAKVEPDDEWTVAAVEPEQVAAVKAAAQAKRTFPQDVAGTFAAFNRGTGIGDEIAGGINAAIGTGKALLTGETKLDPANLDESLGALKARERTRAMGEQRAIESEFTQAHPKIAGLARGTGNIAPMVVSALAPEVRAGGAALQGVPGLLDGMAPQVGRLAGAAKGAVKGIGEGLLSGVTYAGLDEGTLRERAAAMGRAYIDPLTYMLGSTGGAVGGALRARRSPTPTQEQLRAEKNRLYRAVDDMGAAYHPNATAELARGINDDLTAREGLTALNQPVVNVMEIVNRTLNSGQAVTMTQLDKMRQLVRQNVVQPAMRAGHDGNVSLGQAIIRNIDEFVDSAGANQMTTQIFPGFGSNQPAQPSRVAAAMDAARAANTRYRKVQTVNEALRSGDLSAGATHAGGNVDNRTRQKIAPFIDPTSRTQIRNLTPDEAAQAEKTVLGTRGQNAARWAGRSSPASGGLSTQMSLLGAVTNPYLAIVPVTGALSKLIADHSTRKNVRELVDLMARGGNRAQIEAEKRLQELASTNPQVRQVLGAITKLGAKSGVNHKVDEKRRRAGVTVELIQRPDGTYRTLD